MYLFVRTEMFAVGVVKRKQTYQARFVAPLGNPTFKRVASKRSLSGLIEKICPNISFLIKLDVQLNFCNSAD